MNRNLENSETGKHWFKGSQKSQLLKLNLECASPRANNSGFISGMTLDEYFSTVRETTEPEADSDCSSLDLAGEAAIRESDQDNYSSSKDLSSQDTARNLLSQRQDTQQQPKCSESQLKLPHITHNNFGKLRRVEVPALGISSKDKMTAIRSLYGTVNFKKSVRKAKKEDLHTLTLTSFGSKLKKPMLSRRDKPELFPHDCRKKPYPSRGSALETMRDNKQRVALRE